jgi:transcriptional regulator with XRE-family HTH domain
MTPEDFKAWRKGLKFTQAEAAEALGVSKSSVELYEAGKRRDDGRAVEIPKTVALACAAVAGGIAPWGSEG